MADLVGTCFAERFPRTITTDPLHVRLLEAHVEKLQAADLISGHTAKKILRKQATPPLTGDTAAFIADAASAQQALSAWTRGAADRETTARVSAADVVTAENLGRLWQQWYIRARQTVSSLMGIMEARQNLSDDRHRSQLILQYAKTQLRGQLLNRHGTGSTPRRPTTEEQAVQLRHLSTASADNPFQLRHLSNDLSVSSRIQEDEDGAEENLLITNADLITPRESVEMNLVANVDSSTPREQEAEESSSGGLGVSVPLWRLPGNIMSGARASVRGDRVVRPGARASVRGDRMSRAVSIFGGTSRKRERARLLRRWSVSSSKKEQMNITHVTREACAAWFKSLFGGMMREELADQIWRRAAKRAELAERRRSQGSDQRERYRWVFDQDLTLRPNTSSAAHAHLDGFQVLPSRIRLQHEIHIWELPSNEQQPRWVHLRVCARRYFKKLLRKRMGLYQLLVVAGLLGFLCGSLQGATPNNNDLAVYLLLFNTVFGTVVATATISTFRGSGAEGDFFRHEAACGMSQVAEGTARLLIDLVPLFLLPFVFALPLKAQIDSPLWFFDTWLLLAWAISPLGYLFALLAPGNATVLASSVTFVLCSFVNGYFGVRLIDLDRGSFMRKLIDTSPGKTSLKLLFFGLAVELPFGEARAWLIRELRTSGVLPNFGCQWNNYTCASSEQNAILQEELGTTGWWSNDVSSLLACGAIFRVVALVLFVCRSRIDLAGTWRHLRNGPPGRFIEVFHRFLGFGEEQKRTISLFESPTALTRTTTLPRLSGEDDEAMLMQSESFVPGKQSRDPAARSLPKRTNLHNLVPSHGLWKDRAMPGRVSVRDVTQVSTQSTTSWQLQTGQSACTDVSRHNVNDGAGASVPASPRASTIAPTLSPRVSGNI